MKILVAEDDAVSSLVLTAQLRKLGYEVITADNGRDGWYLYRRQGPRIVITDWMMPVIDGLELTRMIRNDPRAMYTYVIILTALGGKGSYVEGMNAGADDFVTKPFDVDTLNARLRVAERVLSLQAEVNQLQGLLPICAYCKRIRDEKNAWQPLESYVAVRADTSFSHTTCPECRKREQAESVESIATKESAHNGTD
jgi:sigma-B regulation protein RsbU (phosphoserine phosphatase)